MFNIKNLIFVITLLIIVTAIIGTSFALWGHNTEVKFKLSISRPEDDDNSCICGTYSSIQEGIDLLKDIQYPKIYDRMDAFVSQLQERIIELNNLPYGGITFDELSQERDQYVNVDIMGFKKCIETYGQHCIQNLKEFYEQSPQEEKQQVPDFWAQHDMLWRLSDQLWDRYSELYRVVDEFWEAGERKIKYGS